MRQLFALVIGQSNAANWGGEPWSLADPRAGLLRESVRIPLSDPVAGADGLQGSVWTRLGQLLLAEELVSDCLFCVCARSATTMNDVVHGSMRRYLDRALTSLRWIERKPNVVIFHLGESDCQQGTGADAYRAAFLDMEAHLRAAGIDAPIMVARATRHSGNTSPELHALQSELGRAAHRLPGPDSDQLGEDLRRDGAHFNDCGLQAFAVQWRDCLRAAGHIG